MSSYVRLRFVDPELISIVDGLKTGNNSIDWRDSKWNHRHYTIFIYIFISFLHSIFTLLFILTEYLNVLPTIKRRKRVKVVNEKYGTLCVHFM